MFHSEASLLVLQLVAVTFLLRLLSGCVSSLSHTLCTGCISRMLSSIHLYPHPTESETGACVLLLLLVPLPLSTLRAVAWSRAVDETHEAPREKVPRARG